MNFSVALAAFWLVFWIAQLVANLNWYLNYNRFYLYVCLLILLLSAAVFGYLAYKEYAPKMAYKVDKNGRCPDCFAKIGDEQFCPNCGKELSGRELARVCPNCGYEELNPKSTSCPKCGKAFNK